MYPESKIIKIDAVVNQSTSHRSKRNFLELINKRKLQNKIEKKEKETLELIMNVPVKKEYNDESSDAE